MNRSDDEHVTPGSTTPGVIVIVLDPLSSNSWPHQRTDVVKLANEWDDPPCKIAYNPRFGGEYQTRPSRSKNKVPYWKRVEKRRRRTKLAKLHKKKIKEALARKAKLQLQAANAGHPQPARPADTARR